MSYFKTCECGAHLDPGERCDCRKPSRQVARCSCFVQRIDFRGESMIECAMEDKRISVKKVYGSKQERDEHYSMRCCGACEQCDLFDALQGTAATLEQTKEA